jgi:hypothetical protein
LAAAFDVAGPAPAGSPGEPSHPAHDSISLDAVFGEEVARRSPAAQPEATPGEAPPGPGRSASTDSAKTGGAGFSFDEFFAGGKQAAGQGGPPAAPGPSDTGSARIPGRTSGRSQRPPEDEADADQFRQWLKKLKS